MSAHIAPAPGRRPRHFADLQRGLRRAWEAARADEAGASIVVVPSRSADKWHETPAETQAYEERLLCLLLGLRRPHLHVIYVTSMPVDQAVVEGYLSLLADMGPHDTRGRLTLLSCEDPSQRPLAVKLVGRPLLLHRIRRAIPDRALAHLVPYSPGPADLKLALALGIPLYGADPGHARLGTKSGARELFAQEGVAHPFGVRDVRSLAGAVSAIASIRAARPEVGQLVVKLDEGASGDGNAIVDVRGLPRPGCAGEAASIERRMRAMAFEAGGVRFDAYLAKLEARGAIVEERIVARELRSPSVQLAVTPAGAVEVISTHDQLLGGPSGQSYLGCRFPADAGYAAMITEQATRVGTRLAREGVVGRFAIDFVVVRGDGARDGRGDDGGPGGGGAWSSYAIEINLRKGATTHPFLTLAGLTGGTYDAARATFLAPSGSPRHLVATDHLPIAGLHAPGAGEVLAILERRGLRFDQARGAGVVAHMLSAGGSGRIGLTAIAEGAGAAQRLYDHAAAVLLEEAALAQAARCSRSRSGGMRAAPVPALASALRTA